MGRIEQQLKDDTCAPVPYITSITKSRFRVNLGAVHVSIIGMP